MATRLGVDVTPIAAELKRAQTTMNSDAEVRCNSFRRLFAMRVASCVIALSLATLTLVAQIKPTATSLSKATVAAQVTGTLAPDPCASKATLTASKLKMTPLNIKAVAAAPLLPLGPQKTMQQVDPVFAPDMAWKEAGDEVMAILVAKHPLSDAEKKAIAAFDESHPVMRERFIFRAGLLNQLINNL